MTTQAELQELAKKHLNNPGVRALMVSIEQQRRECALGCMDLKGLTAILEKDLSSTDGHVSASQQRMVEVSAVVAIAAARYASDHLNLAQTLEGLGEEIEY